MATWEKTPGWSLPTAMRAETASPALETRISPLCMVTPRTIVSGHERGDRTVCALQHDLLECGPASIKESVQSICRWWSVDVPELGLALHSRPGGADQADVGGQPFATRTHKGAELEEVLFDAVVHGRGRTTLAGRDDRDEALAAMKRVVRGTRDSSTSSGARPVEPCLKHVPTGILVPGERFAVGVRKWRGSPVWYQEQAVERDDYAAPGRQATALPGACPERFHEPFAFGIETTTCRVPSERRSILARWTAARQIGAAVLREFGTLRVLKSRMGATLLKGHAQDARGRSSEDQGRAMLHRFLRRLMHP